MEIILTGKYGRIVWTLGPEIAEKIGAYPPGGKEMVEGDIQRYLGRRAAQIHDLLAKDDVGGLGYIASSQE